MRLKADLRPMLFLTLLNVLVFFAYIYTYLTRA
jgi:hypothetical protein